jgi:hypothetical protein
MPYRKNSDETNLGEQGEVVVRTWLKQLGYFIVPTSLIFTGGAPMLEGLLKKYVLPDVLAAKVHPRWVEIKTKTRATFNQKRQRWETGVPLRHWNDYNAVQKHSGIEGSLCFLHLREQRIYLGCLSEIGKDRATWEGKPYPEPEVFFDLNRFDWYEIPNNIHSLLPKPIAIKSFQSWENKNQPNTRQTKF